MSTLRQPYNELSPEVYNALVQAKIALEKVSWTAPCWNWFTCGYHRLMAALSVWKCTVKRCVNPAWRRLNWMRWPAGG